MINQRRSTNAHENPMPAENEQKETEEEVPMEDEPQLWQKEIPSLTVKFALKELKLRVNRLETIDEMEEKTDEVHSTSQPIQENKLPNDSSSYMKEFNFQLIPWFKYKNNAEELGVSNASNLIYYNMHGIDYAFYDTVEVTPVGYMRLKPRQIIPKNRTERYTLHFVIMAGNFCFTTGDNDIQAWAGPGDMEVINKSVCYSIENISDDDGILMFYKK